MENIKLMKIVVVILILILSFDLVSAMGIGVSPSTLEFKDALKGYTYEKELKIDNTGDNLIIAKIDVSGNSDWFEFDPGFEVRVEGKSSSRVNVKLKTPDDLPNGEYETILNIIGTPEEDKGGVSLIPGVSSNIIVGITDKEIIKGYVDSILTRDAEKGQYVQFIISFLNKGNVDISPTARVTVRTNDRNISSFEENFNAVKPGSSESFVAKYNTKDMELGGYYADVGVYVEDELIKENTVNFRVLEGVASEKEVLEEEKVKEGPSVWIGITVIAVILIVGSFIIYWILKLI